ncbi:hypothetical protein H6P81_001482 [Aristolochia fimbriata]|uniref:Pentatricopeptide repeat-containing protein n=1 Tax=Aristolochia fimbriata TaxID=158543 RepID=A0AAV7F7P5_ARIFI|nr:hypothetical protein H6P81_001482 [Aristolochia fimbriata]
MKAFRCRRSAFPSALTKQFHPQEDLRLGCICNTYLQLHTAAPAPKAASDPVAELSSFFSRYPSLRDNAECPAISLTPGIVELVLKRLAGWKPAYEFFRWATQQGVYTHTCYTYNAMADILARAKKKDQLRLLSFDMVSSSIPCSPGALGFFIRCLGTQGLFQEANFVFDHAKNLTCVPNSYTYNCLLEALAKCGQLDLVETRFREMADLGLEPDKYTFTALLQAYCGVGKFEEALTVFDRIYINNWMDEHVFTILVVSLSKQGDVDRAFELINRMDSLNIRLNEKTLYILIHGFSRENRMDEAFILFTKMKQLGFSTDLPLYSVLIDGFCRRKQLGKVLSLYNEMKESGISPDVSVIANLVVCVGGDGDWETVIRLLEETAPFLDEKNIIFIYNSILQGLVSNSLGNKASCLIRVTVESKNLDSDQSKLCKCDEKLKALLCWLSKFKKAGIPNATSFNIVIDALCKSSELDVAVDLANDMTKVGCKGNLLIYNNLIDKLCENDRLEEAYGIFKKMKEVGFRPTQFTYNSIFGCVCRRQNLPDALSLIEEMGHCGYEPWVKHYSFLVKQLCSLGKVEEACKFLHQMVELGFVPNLIAYSSLMNGWCKVGDMDQALNLFHDISSKHHLPDLVAHNVIISGLCKSGRMNEAQDIFNEMLEKGLVPSVVTYNLLIDGWCKIGRIEDALSFSSKMVDVGRLPTVVTYTTLIDGMCNSKQPDEALGMWEKMKERQCSPNRITYLALISGLCKCDRTDEALFYFNEMEKEGYEPITFVYTSLINAFISNGNLLMAFKLLKEMVQKAKYPNPIDKNYSLLIDALMKLYEHKETSLDVQNLLQAANTNKNRGARCWMTINIYGVDHNDYDFYNSAILEVSSSMYAPLESICSNNTLIPMELAELQNIERRSNLSPHVAWKRISSAFRTNLSEDVSMPNTVTLDAQACNSSGFNLLCSQIHKPATLDARPTCTVGPPWTTKKSATSPAHALQPQHNGQLPVAQDSRLQSFSGLSPVPPYRLSTKICFYTGVHSAPFEVWPLHTNTLRLDKLALLCSFLCTVFLVLEFMANGNLFQAIEKPRVGNWSWMGSELQLCNWSWKRAFSFSP